MARPAAPAVARLDRTELSTLPPLQPTTREKDAMYATPRAWRRILIEWIGSVGWTIGWTELEMARLVMSLTNESAAQHKELRRLTPRNEQIIWYL